MRPSPARSSFSRGLATECLHLSGGAIGAGAAGTHGPRHTCLCYPPVTLACAGWGQHGVVTGRRQLRMPVPWRVALVAAFALSVTACASHPEPVPVTPPSQAVAAVDCSAAWDVGWGAVPDDFEPAAVYVCDPVLELAPTPDPLLEL